MEIRNWGKLGAAFLAGSRPGEGAGSGLVIYARHPRSAIQMALAFDTPENTLLRHVNILLHTKGAILSTGGGALLSLGAAPHIERIHILVVNSHITYTTFSFVNTSNSSFAHF